MNRVRSMPGTVPHLRTRSLLATVGVSVIAVGVLSGVGQSAGRGRLDGHRVRVRDHVYRATDPATLVRVGGGICIRIDAAPRGPPSLEDGVATGRASRDSSGATRRGVDRGAGRTVAQLQRYEQPGQRGHQLRCQVRAARPGSVCGQRIRVGGGQLGVQHLPDEREADSRPVQRQRPVQRGCGRVHQRSTLLLRRRDEHLVRGDPVHQQRRHPVPGRSRGQHVRRPDQLVDPVPDRHQRRRPPRRTLAPRLPVPG